MKEVKLMILMLLAMAGSISAKDYYIAPNGSDNAAGTLEAPLATLNKIQDRLRPGDKVYFRGGVYKVKPAQVMRTINNYSVVFFLGRNGTADAPISYLAYLGDSERPVFDFSDIKPKDLRVSAFWLKGSFLHLKGFDIVGVQVTETKHTQSEGISGRGGSNNVIENVAVHDGMGIGFYFTRGNDNLLLNCDAYNNYDSVSEGGKGGNSDGFGFHFSNADYTGNRAVGCRAWMNSDDGFDYIGCKAPVELDHCWALYSGWKDDKVKTPGDGNGFKCGGYGRKVQKEDFTAPTHYIHNCIAVRNKANGFYANHHLAGNRWVNNSAMLNKGNYNMVNQKVWNEGVDVPGYNHVLTRNISYRSSRGDAGDTLNINVKRCTLADNEFALGKDNPFVSTDYKQLMAPRKADGALPDITFMRIKDHNSALYKKGVGYEFDVKK